MNRKEIEEMKDKYQMAKDHTDKRLGITGDAWLPSMYPRHEIAKHQESFIEGWNAAMQRVQELQNNNKLMEEILNVSQLSTDKEGSI